MQTPRIALEAIRAEHAESLIAGLRDERLYEFIDDDPPETSEVLRTRYERWANGVSPDGREIWLNWAVRLTNNGPYIGTLQATIYDDRSASIAYVLFRDHWGHGYARESVTVILNHVQTVYHVSQFLATVDPRNRRSIAMLQALGFEESAIRANITMLHGRSADEMKMQLIL